jgi:hypothetical protein
MFEQRRSHSLGRAPTKVVEMSPIYARNTRGVKDFIVRVVGLWERGIQDPESRMCTVTTFIEQLRSYMTRISASSADLDAVPGENPYFRRKPPTTLNYC